MDNQNQSRTAFSWCPCCKLWVPEDKMERWIAHEGDTPYPRPIQIGGVVRMCQNCLESTPGNSTPVFSTESLVYDPHREQIQCPFCESWDTEPFKTPESPDFWRCKNCGELIYGGE